jgi:glycosyltransferase 2 family protein
MKKYWKQIIKVCTAVLIFYIMITHFDIKLQELHLLWEPVYLIKAYLLVAGSFVLGAWRLRLLIASHIHHFSFGRAFEFSLMGLFFNYLLPGGVGGDLVKGYYLVKEQPSSKYRTMATVLLDRVVGLVAIISICIVSLFYFSDQTHSNAELLEVRKLLLLLALGMLGATAFFIFFRKQFFSFRSKRIKSTNRVVDILERIISYEISSVILSKAFIISVLANILSVYFFVITGEKLGYSVPLSFYFFAVPIGFLSAIIPLAPAGIGVGQVVFFFLFRLYSPDAGDLGLLAISALQIVSFTFAIAGGILYLLRGSDLRRFIKASGK